MLEILSSLVCILWQKRKLHIKTDFEVTGWLLCVIPHIHKDKKYNSDSDHRKHVKNVIKTLFYGLYEDELAFTQDLFWTEYTDFDNNNGSFDSDEFIWKSKDIRDDNNNFKHKNIHFLASRFLVLCHVELHQRFLVLAKQSVHGAMQRKSNLVKYLLSAVMYQRNRVLFINLPVLNNLELNNIIQIKTLMMIVQITLVTNRMVLLTNS